MRLIKLAALSFFFLFLLVTLISMFIPSTVRISRAVDINAGKDSLQTYLADPAKWSLWYAGMDTAGNYYENGNLVGRELENGKQILKIISNRADTINTAFHSGNRKPVAGSWVLHQNAQSVTVQWTVEAKLKWYPWEKFASLLFEKRYGTGMEESLNNLKNIFIR